MFCASSLTNLPSSHPPATGTQSQSLVVFLSLWLFLTFFTLFFLFLFSFLLQDVFNQVKGTSSLRHFCVQTFLFFLSFFSLGTISFILRFVVLERLYFFLSSIFFSSKFSTSTFTFRFILELLSLGIDVNRIVNFSFVSLRFVFHRIFSSSFFGKNCLVRHTFYSQFLNFYTLERLTKHPSEKEKISKTSCSSL